MALIGSLAQKWVLVAQGMVWDLGFRCYPKPKTLNPNIGFRVQSFEEVMGWGLPSLESLEIRPSVCKEFRA